MGSPRHGGDAQPTTTVPAGLFHGVITSGLNQQPTRRQSQALTPPMPGGGMVRVCEQDTQHAASGEPPHSSSQGQPVVALNDGAHSAGANTGFVTWGLLALLVSSARSSQAQPLTAPSLPNQQPAGQQGEQGGDLKRWWPSSLAASWCASACAACTSLAGSCMGTSVWQAIQCFGACTLWSGGLIGRRTLQLLRYVETVLLWAVSAR